MFTPAMDATRACPHCSQSMAQRRLHAHTGRPLVVDHCAPCRHIWFDALESVQLSGLGWVELLREFTRDEAFGPAAQRPAMLPCPVCGTALKAVHNVSRWGRFPMHECPHGHGHWQGDAALLAERGLLRSLQPAERAAVRSQARPWHCLGCGAPAQFEAARNSTPGGDDCRYCASPLLVFDLTRLAHALRQRGAAGEAVPATEGSPLRWPCQACGAALDPTRTAHCPQCQAAVLAQAIGELQPVLDAVEPALRAAANHPHRVRRPPRPMTWRDSMLARWLQSWWRE